MEEGKGQKKCPWLLQRAMPWGKESRTGRGPVAVLSWRRRPLGQTLTAHAGRLRGTDTSQDKFTCDPPQGTLF